MAKGETYGEFVDKFKPKLTTDDCYTPPRIYEVVRNYACEHYGFAHEVVVRPFWPGADYQAFDYPEGCVVVDNPPFSIFSKICEFYAKRGVKFFLFAPSLTSFWSKATYGIVCKIVCDASITYENGAVVGTSFATNLEPGIVAKTAPRLTRLINDEMAAIKATTSRHLPKYIYPDNIVTAAIMQKYARYGIDFEVREVDAAPVRKLDAKKGKQIYGGGLLLSERAAAERAAAERAAAERFELSDREKAIVASLGKE